jgi:hypothetical protein
MASANIGGLTAGRRRLTSRLPSHLPEQRSKLTQQFESPAAQVVAMHSAS